MHFKSPSLGSSSTLLVKVYNNSFLPKNNASTMNVSFRGPSAANSPKPSLASSPKASFRECISAKKEKRKLVFADIFPSSTKQPQNPSNPEESPFRFFANESFSTSGTLSPTTPHIGSYRMYITGRSKRGDKPALKIFATDSHSRQNSGARQLMSPKENEINRETGRLEMIKNKEMEVRKFKEETEKELHKKELMAQIYERLVNMCKNGGSNQSLKSINETIKTQGDMDIVLEDMTSGKFNRIKSSSGRRQFPLNNSLYSMLTHKSVQPPSKPSFFEKLDEKLDLDKEGEEGGRQSITLFKQNIIRLKSDGQSPKSPQYRVKTVVPGSRMKKSEKKTQDKSAARSEPPNESTFHSIKKDARMLRLGESATLYTGEGCSVEDQNLFSIQTTTVAHSKVIKENSLTNLADRLDNVFSKYQNENNQLIAKIQELDQKIRAIQEAKLRKV